MSSMFDIIRDKGHRHEDPVPHDAWENIVKKKNKRRFVIFLPQMAVLLTCSMIAGYFILNYTTGETKQHGVDILKTDEKKIKSDELISEKNNGQKLIGNNSAAEYARINENTNGSGKNSDNVKAGIINMDEQTTTIISTGSLNPVKTQRFTADAFQKSVSGLIPENRNSTETPSPVIDHSIKKNKLVIKVKSRSSIKISGPGTEDADEKAILVKEDLAIRVESTKPLTGTSDKNAELAAGTDIVPAPSSKANINELSDTIKADPVLISEANKATKSAAKKSVTKHVWFFEAALIPVVPFQQYDKAVTFSRSLILKDGNASFSGKLAQSTLDPSLALHVGVRTELNKKLSVKAGVQYLQLREAVTVEGLQTSTLYSIAQGQVNIDDSPGFVDDTSTVILESTRNFSAVNSYSFLTIPLSVQYQFLQKSSWSLGVESGLAINIFNKYGNYIDPNPKAPMTNNSQRRDDKTNLGLSAHAGLRVGRIIAKRAEIFVLPSFSYGLFEQHVKQNLVNKRISLAGIGFGLSYKIW